MLSSCDCCAHLLFLCVLVNSSEKYNECVHVKKSCFFFSQFFFHVKISCLLCAHEKLEQNQIIVKKEKKCLIFYLFQFQSKNLHLHHHQKFFKKHDDKLIQESMKVFKEKLCVLKKKQDSAAFLNDISFNLLISEINVNTIFSVLFDDF